MAFKMKGWSPFDKKENKTSMYKKSGKSHRDETDDEAVQYPGGDVISTKEYRQSLKDGVESESDFAEYKRLGREAYLKKYPLKDK